MNRRAFVKSAGAFAAVTALDFNRSSCAKNIPLKTIRVTGVDSNFEREKLIRPFGFKGGYMTEMWQTASQKKTFFKERRHNAGFRAL